MATRNTRMPLQTTDGGCYFEPSGTNLKTNNRYPSSPLVLPDTGTKIGCFGKMRIPKNYVGTPQVVIIWATTAITGNVVLTVDSKAVADGESIDPNADDDNATITVAASGTARFSKQTTITLTGSYAPDELLQYKISRNGVSASDTMAASCYVEDVFFQYSDS